MFQRLCIRMTAGVVVTFGSSWLLGCSTGNHQAPAAPDEANPRVVASNALTTPPATPTMKAFMDPVTGVMRDPTDAERAALELRNGNAQARQPRAMREQKLRKRGTAMTLEGDPQTPLRACTEAGGGVTLDHSCPQTPASKRD